MSKLKSDNKRVGPETPRKAEVVDVLSDQGDWSMCDVRVASDD